MLTHLLKKKGFFPYDCWDSFEKVKECLPSKVKFCNTLTIHEICDKNYEHIFNVWKVHIKWILWKTVMICV